MIKQQHRFFLAAPITCALVATEKQGQTMDGGFLEKWQLLYETLKSFGEVLSAHVDEQFGKNIKPDIIVSRDLSWLKASDILVAFFPVADDGKPVRSDGLLIEIGVATALEKPIVFVIESEDRSDLLSPSLFFREFCKQSFVAVLLWKQFKAAPIDQISSSLKSLGIGRFMSAKDPTGSTP